MNRYVRSLLSIATLALVMLYGLSVKPTLLTWGGLSVILLIYLLMIWVRPGWWTRARYALSTSSVIALLLLTVADNGCYTANTELSPGFGIKGIIERSQSLGGSCTFSQNQPRGLKLQVMLPITPSTQDDGALKRTLTGNAVALLSLPFSERRERYG